MDFAIRSAGRRSTSQRGLPSVGSPQDDLHSRSESDLRQHRSRYRYPRPASLGPHLLRLRPAQHAKAKIEAYGVTVEQPCHLRWQQDPSGNHVARITDPRGASPWYRAGMIVKREGQVSTQLARKVAAAAAVLGADVAGLLAAAGIAPELLTAVEGRIPLATLVAFFEEAARATGDGAFGLHVAELARQQPDNPLALAVHSSATLGEAFRRVARYVHLVNDTLELRLSTEGPWCRLAHHQRWPAGPIRHGVECSLAMLALLGRQMIGPRFRLESVSFRHDAPTSTAEHTRIFEVAVAFVYDCISKT